MADAGIMDRILDPASRANPYPLYAELRREPVSRLADGTYVVSTYDEIVALLHDPRVSSDPRNHPEPPEPEPGLPLEFIRLDPPEHDRLRGLANRPFGPPHTPGRLDGMRPWLTSVVDRLIDGFAGRDRIDLVDDFAYPLPIEAICLLLGVPPEDHTRFRQWADGLVATFDPAGGTFAERQHRRNQVSNQLGEYLSGLADAHLREPGDDLLSHMLADPGGAMSRGDALSTAALLLVAGHETTVNLIANGMLTLLRYPKMLERLRQEPGFVVPLVEELLRYEPPVHMLSQRSTVADIDIAGTTIPGGSPLQLVLAAGSRDPRRFPEPDRFDPDRADNRHLGYGSGIHYCFGAPLARIETHIALAGLARRLVDPKLVADPPPYRANPVLRGPRHLPVEVAGVRPASSTTVTTT